MGNILSDEEFRVLISLAKRVLWSAPEVRRRIQQHKVNIIPANFYSNIPLVDDVNDSFEYRVEDEEVFNSGIFDKEIISQFMGQLDRYADEFDPSLDGDRDNPAGFFWGNPAFSKSDAMAYYCILRHFKPEHVLEIGSGFSTLVADAALQRNGKGRLVLIEPYPKVFLKKLETVDRILESRVQDIPVHELLDLVEATSIWFIDSTHTVKAGSDCLYLYLKVMPEVRTDLLIHTHDVFLPYGYPKDKILEKHIYWTEQYLLYAYMLDNPKIEVLYGSAYAESAFPDALRHFMRGRYEGGGGSLWYRLNGA